MHKNKHHFQMPHAKIFKKETIQLEAIELKHDLQLRKIGSKKY
jgi:hypothetical protein